MELIGKTTINPIIFYTGKVAGYITWIVLFLMLLGFKIVDDKSIMFNRHISVFILLIGLVFTTISLINLGKSIRLGLPTDDTELKTNGLYKYSRNPMYVGFDLITIAAIIYTLHWVIFILGVYSLITYHLIIKGEETFLIERFGDAYKQYQLKVRRYL
ncbi:MAG: isoprenylcysteine carboxylmethyltransferase family protein [Saprospiraceae bacterium]|nr:isoprenylcysteine carboxylmethyltransferase family protein [Saprospiraceae bacterium]